MFSRLLPRCAALAAFFAVMLGVAVLVAPDTAFAQSNGQFLTEAQIKVWEIYDTLKNVIYIVGGIGIIVLAVFAFFGRFEWKHFFALAGGLFLVALTAELIYYLGGDASNLDGF